MGPKNLAVSKLRKGALGERRLTSPLVEQMQDPSHSEGRGYGYWLKWVIMTMVVMGFL